MRRHLGIAAIGENLGNGRNARPIGCLDLFAARDRQQDQRGRDTPYGARNGIGDIGLDFRQVAERAMRFDVSNAMTSVGRKRLRSTDLIGDKPTRSECGDGRIPTGRESRDVRPRVHPAPWQYGRYGP